MKKLSEFEKVFVTVEGIHSRAYKYFRSTGMRYYKEPFEFSKMPRASQLYFKRLLSEFYTIKNKKVDNVEYVFLELKKEKR